MPDQEYETAAEYQTAQGDAVREAALEARQDNESQPETNEEYYARIEAARQTGIFGDTPTDPTTGDVVVPTSDEEGAGVNIAAVDVAAEEDDPAAEDVTAEEAKRQDSAPAEQVQAEAEDPTDLSDVGRDESDENDTTDDS